MTAQPPGEGVDVQVLLWSGRECWERLVWITSLRSCLPRLPLALPAGGGGARVATLGCAQDGLGLLSCSISDLDLLGMKVLKAAERLGLPKLLDHHLNGGTEKLGRRNWSIETFSFFLISARFTHRCLSVTTMATIDLPIAVAACLVARRAKSVVQRSSTTSSGDTPWPLSRSFSRSAWYAWSTTIVCNEATAWPAAAYALPFKRDVSWRGLDG